MKTITMRVDDDVYKLIRAAADGQRRNTSNFIEFAVMQYLSSSQYVSDAEMNEIMSDKGLLKNLIKGKTEAQTEEYKIV